MNPKFRSQHHKTDMQAPQWLCRLTVGNELVNYLIDGFSQSISSCILATRTNTGLLLSYKTEKLPSLSSRFYGSDNRLAH